MPDSRQKEVVALVAGAVRALGLLDSANALAQVLERDTAEVLDGVDPREFVLVSPADERAGMEVFDFERVGDVHPVQVTFVGPSNRSVDAGLGLIQRWKEAARKRLRRKQPWPFEHADLYRVDVTSGAPVSREAWEANYDVQVLFVFVELVTAAA